jgi:hypothetical protein
MRYTRLVLLVLLTAFSPLPRQSPGQQPPPTVNPDDQKRPEEERRLPNGKSWNISMAKEEHERALKDADELINLAQQLKSELEKSGDFVVPLSTMKKTDDIEKLAKRIRSRLHG